MWKGKFILLANLARMAVVASRASSFGTMIVYMAAGVSRRKA